MSKKILIALLVIALLGGLIFWYYTKHQSKGPASDMAERAKEERIFAEQINELRKSDSDLDGLADTEEQKLGTSPKRIDTDGDGVTDYDEVKRWKTNPLKKDSDGDGKSDGSEIGQGQNPIKK